MEDLLGRFNPKDGGPNNNRKIIEFAQKTQASALQITNTDRPIFEIISSFKSH